MDERPLVMVDIAYICNWTRFLLFEPCKYSLYNLEFSN